MGDDAGGVVDEADEIGLDGFAAQAGVQIGAVEGVGLPEVVGVGFGKGEAGFGAVVAEGFEEVELFDDATEGVGGDLFAADEAAARRATRRLRRSMQPGAVRRVNFTGRVWHARQIRAVPPIPHLARCHKLAVSIRRSHRRSTALTRP